VRVRARGPRATRLVRLSPTWCSSRPAPPSLLLLALETDNSALRARHEEARSPQSAPLSGPEAGPAANAGAEATALTRGFLRGLLAASETSALAA
jgi:hypothetical protein